MPENEVVIGVEVDDKELAAVTKKLEEFVALLEKANSLVGELASYDLRSVFKFKH